MKTLALLALLALTSCTSHVTMCKHMAYAQYRESCDKLGKENAQLWILKNDGKQRRNHIQARERRDGVWYWIPNQPVRVDLSIFPQRGCLPSKQLTSSEIEAMHQ